MSLMEMRSLSENTPESTPMTAKERFRQRISAWRRTMSLFHRYNKLGGQFEGPFHEAGYTRYTVEPKMQSITRSTEYTPDIIAWDEERERGLIVEITTNPNNFSNKTTQMNHYKTDLNIDGLNVYGGSAKDGYDILLSHPRMYDQPQQIFCEVAVGDTFQVRNETLLEDKKLCAKLQSFQSRSLVENVPEISIALLPEMSGSEIRVGLAALVMSMFKSGSEGLTAEEFVDKGLERLAERINPRVRRELVKNVKKELDLLVKSYLDVYLTYDTSSQKYMMTTNGKKVCQHFHAKKAAMIRLLEWIDDKPPSGLPDSVVQTTLDSFVGESDVDDYENLLH